MIWFQPQIQQRQHVDGLGCRISFGGLINMFVFNILQIPGRCIQICKGFISPTFNPLAKGLVCALLLPLKICCYSAKTS